MTHGDFPKPNLSGFNLKKRPSVIDKTTDEAFDQLTKAAAETVSSEQEPRTTLAPVIPAPPVTDAPLKRDDNPPALPDNVREAVSVAKEAKKIEVAPATEKRGRGRPRKSTQSDVAVVDGDIKSGGKAYNQIVSFRLPDEQIEKLDQVAATYGQKRIGAVTMMINIMTLLEHVDCDLNAISESYSSVLKLRKVLELNTDEELKAKLKSILKNEIDGVSE